MWPKALAQLIELAPHIGRLVPAANRLLNPGAASEEASRNSMQQVAEGLRGDIGQVTASHDSLQRQLTEQSGKLSMMAVETRAGFDRVEGRIEQTEHRSARLLRLLVINSIALAALLVLVILLLLRR